MPEPEPETTTTWGVQRRRAGRYSDRDWSTYLSCPTREEAESLRDRLRGLVFTAVTFEFRVVKITTEVCDGL